MTGMFNSKLVCPKCGHECSVTLGHAEGQVIHVAAPGTAITCPSCGATFSGLEGYPKAESCSQSLKVIFSICALILFLAVVWWMLK